MALLRHHVEQHRTGDLFRHGQVFLQLADAVAVDGAVVVEAQVLEEHAAHEARLDGVFELEQEPLHGVADHRHPREHLLHFRLDARVQRVHADAIQRLGQAADPRADRHLVVVEHDDQVLLQAAGVVQSLQHDAGTEGPVADDRDAVPLFLGPQQVVRATHAQDATRGAAGVARKEKVVFAFRRVGIPHQSATDADRLEILVASGNQLVRIDLMAGVPDQAIAAEVEGGVQGQGELDHAQIGGEVGRPPRGKAAQGLADLAGQLHQFLLRKSLQVAGGFDLRKNLVHQRSLSRT